MVYKIRDALRISLFALSLLVPRPGAAETRRLAVIVGANIGAEGQVRLHHAARDAEKVAALLEELGGVRPENLVLLTHDPTSHDVLRALEDMEERARAIMRAGGDVALTFYYSGHANAKALQLTGTRLSLKGLRRYLAHSKITVRLAILDACHSGAAIRAKGGHRTRRPAVRFSVRERLGAEGYAVLTSSAAGEESQESDELRGGFFTHYLVSGLRGAADTDGDRHVTLNEAYRYAYARTLRATAGRTGASQHPTFDLGLAGGGELVLTELLGDAGRVKLVGAETGARWILYSPHTGRVVAELDERPGETTWVWVPAGELEVYRRSASAVQRGTITVKAGVAVPLTRAALEPVPMTAYLRKGQLGLLVTAQVGVQSFGAEGTRTQMVGPAPIFSVGVQFRDLLMYNLDLGLDVGFTSLKQNLTLSDGTAFSQLMIQTQVGASLRYRVDLARFTLSAGPRAAWLYLSRESTVSDVDLGAIHTVAAGGVVGAAWRYNERFSVGLDVRVSWVPLANDAGLDTNQVLIEGQMAVGFHF